MAQPCRVTHVVPADQPQSVAQIADILFSVYTVDGGRVSLAGCSMEDRLVLRLRFQPAVPPLEIYLNAEGKEIDGQPVAGIAPEGLIPLPDPPQAFGAEFERLLSAGVRLAEERLPTGTAPDLDSATAIWCKYVDGKLRFTIGSASIDLPFSGWTMTLAPPSFTCAHTGTPTYHLAATDDGRIVASDAIKPCDQTGRRILGTELITCSVTGQRVSPDLIESCPISGRRLLRSVMVECASCHQRSSPGVVERGLCLACRRLKRVMKTDPRMARVLHEHPTLDRWRQWRIGETARAYILVALGWTKRLLVVVDKETLELKYVATGSRLVGGWEPAEPAQYSYVLRE